MKNKFNKRKLVENNVNQIYIVKFSFCNNYVLKEMEE